MQNSQMQISPNMGPMPNPPLFDQQMQQQQHYQQQQQFTAPGSNPGSSAPKTGMCDWSRFAHINPEDLDDDDDDDLNNIDTSNMTQEEKDALRKLRKLRKMNREKLKRAKLNDQFVYLSKMLAIGSTTRIEKLTVLNETIRAVHKLQHENDGLRQQKKRIMEELDRRRNGAHVQSNQVWDNREHHQMNDGMSVRQEPNDHSMKVKQEHFQPSFDQHAVKQERGSASGGFKSEPGSHNAWGFQKSPQDNSDLDFAFGTGDGLEDFWADEPAPRHSQRQVQQIKQPQWEHPKFPHPHSDSPRAASPVGGTGTVGSMFGLRHFSSANGIDSINMFLADDDASDLLSF